MMGSDLGRAGVPESLARRFLTALLVVALFLCHGAFGPLHEVSAWPATSSQAGGDNSHAEAAMGGHPDGDPEDHGGGHCAASSSDYAAAHSRSSSWGPFLWRCSALPASGACSRHAPSSGDAPRPPSSVPHEDLPSLPCRCSGCSRFLPPLMPVCNAGTGREWTVGNARNRKVSVEKIREARAARTPPGGGGVARLLRWVESGRSAARGRWFLR